MFGKLKNALEKTFSKISQSLEPIKTREITKKDIDKLYDEILFSLVEADVAYDVAEKIIDHLSKKLIGQKIGRLEKTERFIKNEFSKILYEILKNGESNIDLESLTKKSKPVKILIMGVNGVGKTTTIAKLAKHLSDKGYKVMVVAADTFRAGAQEQLKIHCKNIGVPIFQGKYGSDPGAVVHDALKHAEKTGYDFVIIDTAGRQHTDIDLMNEIKKVVKVANPDIKILILDALTGNDAIVQAEEFNKNIGVDAVILTKLDADASGGPALSIIAGIQKPILYLGVGQRYDDLVPYSAEYILNKILS